MGFEKLSHSSGFSIVNLATVRTAFLTVTCQKTKIKKDAIYVLQFKMVIFILLETPMS
jgi:hypothetical protein